MNSQLYTQPARNNFIDFLKGIAVLLMVQVHILELFAHTSLSESYLGRMLQFLGGPMVAPVFLIYFGYFISASNKNLKENILRGIQLFLLGMILNILLNFNFIAMVLSNKIQGNIWPYLFGADILHLAGLSLVVISLFIYIAEKNSLILLIATVFSMFIPLILKQNAIHNTWAKYILSFFYGNSHWSYFPLRPWLAYTMAGYLFHTHYHSIKKFLLNNKIITLFFFIACSIILVISFQYGFTFAVQLQKYYHHNLFYFLWTSNFLIVYFFVSSFIFNRISQNKVNLFLQWIGKNVTVIYFFQWIMIGNLATEIYKSETSLIKLLLYFIAILSLSCLLTLAFNRLKKTNL